MSTLTVRCSSAVVEVVVVVDIGHDRMREYLASRSFYIAVDDDGDDALEQGSSLLE